MKEYGQKILVVCKEMMSVFEDLALKLSIYKKENCPLFLGQDIVV